MLTKDHASLLIDYLELMEGHTDHQRNMADLKELGSTEEELDEACKALGKIAGRTYGII